MAAMRCERQTPAMRTRSRPPATTLRDVPDHLLELVIRRLDSRVPLLRAAAVCKRWRRIVSIVLTRTCFRTYSCYAASPHVFGYYHVPDPSYSPPRRTVFVPAAHSTADARHFSLDFLPRPRRRGSWKLVDGRGSLLLLANARRGFFPDLVVCEPMSRRYRRIFPDKDTRYHRCLGVFIAKDSIRVSMSESDLKVICVVYDRSDGMAQDVGSVTACIYSHRYRRGWDWHNKVSSNRHIHGAESAMYAGRSAGLICWSIDDEGTVLAARTSGGIFGRLCVPEQVRGPQNRSNYRFVDDDWKVEYPQIVRLACLIGDELRVYVQEEPPRHAMEEWVLERSLCLPEATLGLPGRKDSYFGRVAKIVTAGDGYIVLTPAEET
ncbi:hypothetical protein C2845_PM03G31610 [Panicum miliaceum]|uniref:F-box domain-containing protein n=1 Tax=Panicum miliaceum TaxID=4540 RepID=A0A3L6T7H5_PANMI|nr:hypothetical protein C2845_PM03G31610 [Panicum miliaceum]